MRITTFYSIFFGLKVVSYNPAVFLGIPLTFHISSHNKNQHQGKANLPTRILSDCFKSQMPGKTIRKPLDALRRPMSLQKEVNNAVRLLCNFSTVKSAFSLFQLLAKTPANEPSAYFSLRSINKHPGSPHNHYKRALR